MLQIYAFHGMDVQEVYTKLNCFLQELAGIDVPVNKDDIRSNTKYYPDWDRTATTIEVCLDFTESHAPYEIADQVCELHHVVLLGKTEPPTPDEPEQVKEVRALLVEHKSKLLLSYSEGEGYMLSEPACTPDNVAVWGVPAERILAVTRRCLGIDVPASDDFDPFLDSDDLP